LKLDTDGAWQQQFANELTKAKAVADPDALPERLASLIEKLTFNLLEREEAVRLCILGALARESVFLIGPPGVAKSLIARRIKELFAPEAKAFEYLMNRFSTPDEIFGPVSIAALKADRLERKTKSYLPGADVVFLDEIWKAGPSIQNALLTAINERIFRNDGVDQPIPLRALISASNELPAEDEGLEALWDRFLVRLEVGNIVIKENRHKMIRGSSQMGVLVGSEERFVKREFESLDHQIDNVSIPDEVLSIIDDLIPQIAQFNHELEAQHEKEEESDEPSEFRKMYVSDRRWKKIGRLLRTSALCNGRFAVNELDCYLISYCIWNDQEQINRARQIVIAAIENRLALTDLRQEWRRLQTSADKLPGTQYTPPTAYSGHFKIDLSKNGKLLSDPRLGEFPKLPKQYHESLTSTFTPVQLIGANDRRATVLAKHGATPECITLMKDDHSPPLKPFPSTDFRLTSAKKSVKKSIVNRSSEAARKYLIELEEFRAKLKARRGKTEGFLNGSMHVFVDLSSEVLDRLSDTWHKTNHQLDNLLQEVDTFAKAKGLE
jgi:MoxR-like ATPase